MELPFDNIIGSSRPRSRPSSLSKLRQLIKLLAGRGVLEPEGAFVARLCSPFEKHRIPSQPKVFAQMCLAAFLPLFVVTLSGPVPARLPVRRLILFAYPVLISLPTHLRRAATRKSVKLFMDIWRINKLTLGTGCEWRVARGQLRGGWL